MDEASILIKELGKLLDGMSAEDICQMEALPEAIQACLRARPLHSIVSFLEQRHDVDTTCTGKQSLQREQAAELLREMRKLPMFKVLPLCDARLSTEPQDMGRNHR